MVNEPPELNSLKSMLIQTTLAALLGMTIFIILSGIFIVGIEIAYAGRIYPGVVISGVDISGLSLPDALTKISSAVSYPRTAEIQLQYKDRVWEYLPVQLGVTFDPGTTLQDSYQICREGPFDRWLGDILTIFVAKHPVSPVFIFNENVSQKLLQNLANQIDQPTIEAGIEVRGAEILARAGQVGITLDIPASMNIIEEMIGHQQEGRISLIVKETAPELMDASKYADAAHQILSAPLTLTAPPDSSLNNGPWVINQDVLANMLILHRSENGNTFTYNVGLKDEILLNFLSNLAPQVNTIPENPRFTFNESIQKLELLKSGIQGQTLDLEKSLALIQEKVEKGDHVIPLVFTCTSPTVLDSATAEQLGIREQIDKETSFFYGSDTARIQNIQMAASRFNGVLVAPGETFSMARTMGDISLNNGYAEALIIYNGQTIEGVGGGVCQVSTTLFRTAFFSGFPIIERHPHAYRVRYYEKIAGNRIDPTLAGLDATVYVPEVDLKFKNDTPFWLLMETEVSVKNNTITWRFYSTSDGRKITWLTSGPTNLVDPPPPLYKENDSLSTGEIKQVDWEAQGADVIVSRTVCRNDSICLQDTFNTHYEPWRAVYEYGPGTEGIPPQQTP